MTWNVEIAAKTRCVFLTFAGVLQFVQRSRFMSQETWEGSLHQVPEQLAGTTRVFLDQLAEENHPVTKEIQQKEPIIANL